MRKPRYKGRRRPSEEGKPRILVLCEATDPERSYFNALKADFGLTSVRVQSAGTIADMMKRVEREVREDPTQEEIWCVLDHDERVAEIDRFNRWLRRPRRTTTRIDAAMSVPCFEYWILLHFTFTTKTYRGTGDMSACKQVRRELRNHIADYKKTDLSIYRRCRERLDTAIKHGRRVPVTRDALSGTDVGRLIERLKRL